MKINKSLNIDLNIISPQRNIQIHEGDIDSIDIVLAVSADDVPLDLTGLTIKYDATINNYLAEQDANGSVDDNKIVIPVTENMAAMPGLLLIDVRMIQGDEILFTRKIRATVERAVVDGSTYIDFSKITINQRLNALEEQMTYIEELVDGLDTSKQITSNRRPPQTAPSTVDVDFFRVGDTWIYQGVNIVYKLVEAEYNYQPDPEVPAVHKLTWQPLNERFNFGTTEPPTSATYTEIEYVIGDLTFNALPVSEYFKGDTYAHLVSGEIQTLSVLTNAAEVSSGQYTFTWHENGGGDADNKMDLAPINPTAQAIEDMPSGQLYGDTVNHKGVIKGGQEFYDSTYVDENLQRKTYFGYRRPDCYGYEARLKYEIGDRYYCESDKRTYVLNRIIEGPVPPMYFYEWAADTPNVTQINGVIPQHYYTGSSDLCEYVPGDIVFEYSSLTRAIIRCYVLQGLSYRTVAYQFGITFTYYWQEIAVPYNYYTKGETGTLLSTKENTSNKVTSLSAQSTDTQYPSAKCVYDMIGDMDGALNLKEDTANKSDDFSMGLTPTQAERDLYPTVARMKELLVDNYYDRDQIDAMIGDIESLLAEV